MNLALNGGAAGCTAGDENFDATITVDEIVRAVVRALDGCPQPASVCGDGRIDIEEQCDDLNPTDGDGCSSLCRVESGWRCSSYAPTVCRILWGRAYSVNEQSGSVTAAAIGPDARGTSRPERDEIRIPGFPRDIDVSRDGRRAFVTTRQAGPAMPGALAIVDTVTREVRLVGEVGTAPEAVACHPDGSAVYVSDVVGNKVTVVDPVDGSVLAVIPVGEAPNAIAFDPRGHRAYVANASPFGGTVSAIDTRTNRVSKSIAVGRDPTAIACNPNGQHCFVADFTTGTISVLDVKTDFMVSTVLISGLPGIGDAFPVNVVFDLEGTRVYVASWAADSILVLDAAKAIADPANAVMLDETIRLVDHPFPTGLALNGAETRALVTNFEIDCETGFPNRGSVAVVDLAAGEIADRIPVGALALGIAIAPAPETVPSPELTPTPENGRRCGAVVCSPGERCELDRTCHLQGGDCSQLDRCVAAATRTPRSTWTLISSPSPSPTPTLSPTNSPTRTGTPTPTRTPTRTATPSATALPSVAGQLAVQVFEAQDGTLYYVLGVDLPSGSPGIGVQVTSVAISSGGVIVESESTRAGDPVVTAIAAARSGNLIDLARIRRTTIVRDLLRSSVIRNDPPTTADGEFYPDANEGCGTLVLPTEPGAELRSVSACGASTESLFEFQDSSGDVPGGRVAPKLFRRSIGQDVDSMVFPRPGSNLVVSAGPFCDGPSRLPCDPADRAGVVCGSPGLCPNPGGEVSAQTVTVDDTIGTVPGNEIAQSNGSDGFFLRGGRDVLVLVVEPAGEDAAPRNAAAAGFVVAGRCATVDRLCSTDADCEGACATTGRNRVTLGAIGGESAGLVPAPRTATPTWTATATVPPTATATGGRVPTTTATPIAGDVVGVSLVPGSQVVPVGGEAVIDVRLDTRAQAVSGGGVFLAFDPAKLEFQGGTIGSAWGALAFRVEPRETEPGVISLAAGAIPSIAGADILVATLRFTVTGGSPSLIGLIFIEGAQQTQFVDSDFNAFRVLSDSSSAQIIPLAATRTPTATQTTLPIGVAQPQSAGEAVDFIFRYLDASW